MLRTGAFFLLAVTTSATKSADPPAKKPYGEPPAVRSLSFSPDGSRLAAAVMPKNRGGIVFVWNASDGKLISKYDRAGESPTASFAHDGKSIVVANGRTTLSVLDPAKGEKIGDAGPFAVEVTSLLSAGEDRFVVLGKDNTFRVWDVKEKKVVHEFALNKRLWGWAVSPGGKWLFANGEGTDRLWDLTNGKEIEGIFTARPGTANVAVFIAEDRLLLGSNSGTHRIFDVPSGKEVLRFKNEGGTGGVAFSGAAGCLACRYYSSPSCSLTPLSFNPPSATDKDRAALLLKACDDDDYAKREKAAAALVELGPTIEPLLRQAASSERSAEVRMRARVTRELILNKPKFHLVGHSEEIRPMVFSPDGKLFATGAADGLVILWDPKTGKEVGRMNAGE